MKEEQNVKKASVPKAFAGVYYTAIALVAVLLLIFSLVTYYFLPASTSTSVDTASAYAVAGRISGMDRSTSSGKDSAVAEIVSALDDMGLTSAPATKQRSNATVKSEQQKVTATTGNGPTYTVMDFSAENIGFVIDRDTVTDMSHGDDETEDRFVETLTEQVAVRSEQVETLNTEKVELENQLNTVYYIVGTEKELREAQIINKQGFIGRTLTVGRNSNFDSFTMADSRLLSEVPVGQKKATLVTSHPEGSYELVTDANKVVEKLIITDPVRFWESSKILIISCK